MKLISLILCFLGLTFGILPSLIKSKKMKGIILLVFLSNFFMMLGYMFSDSFNGAVSCGLSALYNIGNFICDSKNRKTPSWLMLIFLLSAAAFNLCVFTKPVELFAVLPLIGFVLSTAAKTPTKYRFWVFICQSGWLIYDTVSQSYEALLVHIIVFSSNLFGILFHDTKLLKCFHKKSCNPSENMIK